MPTSNWPISVDAVGTLLRARTRDTQGNEVGTFNTDTRPTEDQVLSLINTAVEDLASVVGTDLDESLWTRAATVAGYKAAMLVELSYFPEQVARGNSLYEQLRDLHAEALKNFLKAVAAKAPGEAPGDVEAPSYAFPLPSVLDHVLGPVPGGYVVPGSLLW